MLLFDGECKLFTDIFRPCELNTSSAHISVNASVKSYFCSSYDEQMENYTWASEYNCKCCWNCIFWMRSRVHMTVHATCVRLQGMLNIWVHESVLYVFVNLCWFWQVVECRTDVYILVHTTVIGFWYVLMDVYICQQILFGKPVAHVMISLNAEKFLLVGRASWQKFVPLQLFF